MIRISIVLEETAHGVLPHYVCDLSNPTPLEIDVLRTFCEGDFASHGKTLKRAAERFLSRQHKAAPEA